MLLFDCIDDDDDDDDDVLDGDMEGDVVVAVDKAFILKDFGGDDDAITIFLPLFELLLLLANSSFIRLKSGIVVDVVLLVAIDMII